jgi:hypothetical protein
MIDHRTFGTTSRTVGDQQDRLIVGPRGPIRIDDLQFPHQFADRERSPSRAMISGSAAYGAQPVTIDLTDYAEITAPHRADPFLRSAVGPLLTLAAAAAVAIALAMTPASDRSAFPAGPLSGHSMMHFPR